MTKKTNLPISNRRIDNIKACEKVDSLLLRKESELFGSKYADYAFMGPVEATRLFRHEYTHLFQIFHRKYVSVLSADKKLGLKRADFFENDSSTINSVWKARQKADELGVPYDFYLWSAFEFLHKRGYKRSPRPNQLYSEAVVKDVTIKWQVRIKDKDSLFELSNDPRFLHCNNRGEPAQVTYRKLLLKRLKAMPVWDLKRRLAVVCFKHRLLDPKVITEVFELDYDDVKRLWDGKVYEEYDEVDESDFRRPCYGLPHVAQVHECKACPLKDECSLERKVVEQAIVRRHGHLDISGERKRAQQRERKRRQREKEKLLFAEAV